MIKIKKLLINYPENNIVCKMLIPLSKDPSLEIKGKIFTILEYEKNDTNNELIDFLDQKINKYYNSIFLKINNKKVEDSFENFLYNLNYEFRNFLKEKQISIDLKKINLIIGVLYPDKSGSKYFLHFSQIGSLESILIYQAKDKKNNIAQIKNSTDEDAKTKDSKIFSNIVSGKIKINNSLIFCTENILDYLTLDKLKETVGKLNPNDASAQIKNLLLETNEGEAFGGIIIKILSPKTDPLSLEKEKEKEKENIPLESEPQTDEQKKDEVTVFPYAHKEKDHISKKEKKSFSAKTNKIIKNIFKLPNNYKKSPRFKKVFSIIAVILTILLIGNIFQAKNKQIKEEDLKHYQALLTQIDDKKIELESSLIYSDPNKSTAILLSLENLIAQLPEGNDNQKTKLKEIKEQIKKLSFKAKLIEEIDQPQQITDYSKLNDSPVLKIIKDGSFIYSLNENNIFFKLSLDDLSVNKIEHDNLNLPLPLSIINTENKFITLHENNSLSQLSKKEDQFSPLNIKFPKSDIALIDIFNYGNKLYTLDKLNNQIYKHLPSGENFSDGRLWLEEDLNLNNSVSMVIDGSIYILDLNGNIINLFKGRKNNFEFDNKNSLLAGPKKIWTDSDSKYLYVLDVAGKKVAVIDKKGALIIQYYSENFKQMNDFVVNEKKEEIYILANQKLFKIEMKHLLD